MKNIKNEYKGFLDDIEKNIKNKEDLEYVKKRFTAFLDPVLDEINSIIEYKKEEVEELEKRQQEIERKMSKMQSVIDNIEKDIYAEDGFDFEIVCPYCNHEFVADVESELREEVECPKCHNIIELDWNDDEEESSGCSGHCQSCGHYEEEFGINKEDNDNDDDDM